MILLDMILKKYTPFHLSIGMKWLTESIEMNYKQLSKRVLKETTEQKDQERKEREEKRRRIEERKQVCIYLSDR